MVNVNKNIVPGKKAEPSTKTEPQAPARRPRNQELNSSKKSKHTKRRSLNSSLATGLDRLIGAVKSSDAQDYYEKFKVMQTNPAYEEELMADAYYKAEQMLSEQLGVPNVMLETSVQNGRGSVDAWADGGTGDHLASYDFEDESNAVWDIIKNWSGDSNGLVDAVAKKIVDFVSLSTDVDSSCGDKTDVDSSLNCEAGSTKVSGTVTIYNDFADLDNDTTERLLRSRIEKAVPDAKVDFEKINDTDVKVKIDCPDADAEKARLAVESSDVTKSVDWESATEELDSSKKLNSSRWDWDAWNDYAEQISASPQITEAVAQYADGDGDLEIEKVLQPTGAMREYLKQVGIDALIFVYDPTDREGYEEILGWTGSGIDDNSAFNLADIQDKAVAAGFDIDSSKKLNCDAERDAEGDAKITTESGNEVSISDIQIIQNPDTNELSLFIKEDEDEEIPEGFVVIATATQAALPADATCPNCGQEPCVCEDEGELDSSKKKN